MKPGPLFVSRAFFSVRSDFKIKPTSTCYKGLSHVTTENYLSVKILLSALRNEFLFCVFSLEHHTNFPLFLCLPLLVVYRLPEMKEAYFHEPSAAKPFGMILSQ